jgi:hypothetical protein
MGQSLVVYLPGTERVGISVGGLPPGWCTAADPVEGAFGVVQIADPQRARDQVEGLASILHHEGADTAILSRLAACRRVVGLTCKPTDEGNVWAGARWLAAKEEGFIFDGRRLTDGEGFQLFPTPPVWLGVRGRLAQRACACMAVACRGLLDPGDRTRGEPVRNRLILWVGEHGLLGGLTAEEVSVLKAPIGTVAPEVLVAAAWRLEWVHVLLWSLGMGALLPPDRQEHPEVLGRAVGLMSPTLPPALGSESGEGRPEPSTAVPSLRWMELALREGGREPFGWEPPIGPGAAERDGEGRILLQGRPLAEVEDGLRATVYSVVCERLACLRWVMRQGEG